MVIDFRVKAVVPGPVVVANEQVESLHKYKYLGIILDDKLTRSANTQKLYKKCQQRVHFLRVLYWKIFM